MSFRVSFASVMRKIASYLTKNRSETGRKIAQSTHENEYIKQEKKLFVEIQNSFLHLAEWKIMPIFVGVYDHSL